MQLKYLEIRENKPENYKLKLIRAKFYRILTMVKQIWILSLFGLCYPLYKTQINTPYSFSSTRGI